MILLLKVFSNLDIIGRNSRFIFLIDRVFRYRIGIGKLLLRYIGECKIQLGKVKALRDKVIIWVIMKYWNKRKQSLKLNFHFY